MPLLMRVPWLSSGQQRLDGSVGHIDLVPTILDLLGEPRAPATSKARGLVPVLRGDETLDGNDVFIEWNGISPTVRGDRFPGQRRHQPHAGDALPVGGVGPVEVETSARGDQGRVVRSTLGPLRTDQPVSDDPAQRDRIRDMAARIRMWQYETGDTAALPGV